jgi:colicin import membrane protein
MATSTAPVSLLVRRPDAAFVRFVFWSTLLHAVIFGLAVVWALIHETPAIDLNQTPIKATLVRQGRERDEKLLPRIEEAPPPPQEQKAPEPVAPPEPPKVAAPAPAPTPAPPKAKQAGEKQGDKQKLFGAFDKAGKKPTELTGAADGDPQGDAAKAEGEAYYARLQSQIKRYYDVSDTIPDAERIRLVAQVAIFVNPSGQLDRARLARASGNDLFDSAVMTAVKRAAPFSPPPPHLRDPLQKYGVVLQFRP